MRAGPSIYACDIERPQSIIHPTILAGVAEPDLYAEMFRRFGTETYKRFFRIQRFE